MLGPDVLVIDSIQTMVSSDSSSAPGSVSQVRQSASAIIRHAKTTRLSVFLVGHVTKDGTLAGPRVLEHMVDTVLSFEGDRQHEYRLLRATKNRFGSVNELGVFEMRQTGMFPVANPSETLLSQRARGASGSVVFCTMRGSRPILCDLQALAAHSFYPCPSVPSAAWIPAVSRCYWLSWKNARARNSTIRTYMSASPEVWSWTTRPPTWPCAWRWRRAWKASRFHKSSAVMGEVGLCGEVRPIANAERRVAECMRLGFTEIILPQAKPEEPPGRQKRNRDRRGYADAGAGGCTLT